MSKRVNNKRMGVKISTQNHKANDVETSAESIDAIEDSVETVSDEKTERSEDKDTDKKTLKSERQKLSFAEKVCNIFKPHKRLKKVFDEQTSRLKKLEEDYAALQKEIESRQSEYNKLLDDKNTADSNNEKLHLKISEISSLLDEEKNKSIDVEANLTQTAMTLSKVQKENETLTTAVNNLKNELDELHRINDLNTSSNFDDVKKLLDESERKRKEAAAECRNKDEFIKQLQDKQKSLIADKDSEIESLNLQLTEAQHNSEDLNNRIEQINIEKKEIKDKLESANRCNEELNSKLAEYLEENADIANIERVKQENDNLKDEVDKLKTEIDSQSKNIRNEVEDEYKGQISELKLKLEAAKEDYSKELAQAKEDASKELAQAKEDAAKELAQVKEDASKELAQAKEDAAKELAQVKEDAAKELSAAKDQASEMIAESRAKALEELEAEKKRGREERDEIRQHAKQRLEETKAQNKAHIEKIKQDSENEINKLRVEAAEELVSYKEEAAKKLAEHKAQADSDRENAAKEIQTLNERRINEQKELKNELEILTKRADSLFETHANLLNDILQGIVLDLKEAYPEGKGGVVGKLIDSIMTENDMMTLPEYSADFFSPLLEGMNDKTTESIFSGLRKVYEELLKPKRPTWLDSLMRLDALCNVDFIARQFADQGLDIRSVHRAADKVITLLSNNGIFLDIPNLFVDTFNADKYEAQPIKDISSQVEDVASHVGNPETIVDIFTIGYHSEDNGLSRRPAVSRLNA